MAAAPLKLDGLADALAAVNYFRSRKAAAPLKRVGIGERGVRAPGFRSRKAAAPLKPCAPQRFWTTLSSFRSRKAAAPLKRVDVPNAPWSDIRVSAVERLRPHCNPLSGGRMSRALNRGSWLSCLANHGPRFFHFSVSYARSLSAASVRVPRVGSEVARMIRSVFNGRTVQTSSPRPSPKSPTPGTVPRFPPDPSESTAPAAGDPGGPEGCQEISIGNGILPSTIDGSGPLESSLIRNRISTAPGFVYYGTRRGAYRFVEGTRAGGRFDILGRSTIGR